MSDEEPEHYEIKSSLGQLDLEVSGTDEEWVQEQFEKQWAERLEEAENMAQALRGASKAHQ